MIDRDNIGSIAMSFEAIEEIMDIAVDCPPCHPVFNFVIDVLERRVVSGCAHASWHKCLAEKLKQSRADYIATGKRPW